MMMPVSPASRKETTASNDGGGNRIHHLIRFFDGLSGAAAEKEEEEEVKVLDSDGADADADADAKSDSASSLDSEEEDRRRFQVSVDFPLTPDGIKNRISFLDSYEQRHRGTQLTRLRVNSKRSYYILLVPQRFSPSLCKGPARKKQIHCTSKNIVRDAWVAGCSGVAVKEGRGLKRLRTSDLPAQMTV